MNEFVYFDIETIPSQKPETLEMFRAAVKPPATHKKQETIDAWLAENREEAARKAMAETSFDPAHGHICTIAWATDDGEIWTVHAETVERERDVLLAFFRALDPYHSQTMVGHYINGFDLRFILCRAVVLGLKIPQSIPRDLKPWSDRFADTMVMWAGAKDRISMDNLAAALGIKGKDGFDGSMVAEAWAKGEHDRIMEYCKDDVRVVREIHGKFLAAGW